MIKERELPVGWEWKRLGEIGKIYSGSTPSTSNPDYFDGDIPWITPADLSDFQDIYIERGKRNITQKGLQSSSVQMLPKDTILFSSRAPIGYVALAANPVTTNQGFKNLVLKGGIDPKYVYYYLKTHKHEMQKYGSGTTFLEVSAARFSKIPIIVPPLPIQRQIVVVLEQAEALKRQRQEADALTGALLQSVFSEMFGDPVRNEKGYRVKKLKDISEVVSGVTKGRKFNGKSTLMVPYLRVANVQDGFLDLSEIKEIEVLESDIEKFQLKPGDVILTEGGDRDKLGRGHVWYGEIPLCLHQNHIFRVRLDEKILHPEFFSFLIGSAYGKKYFAKSAKQTTGIASINSTQLKNFPALVPPLALQQQFAHVVESVERIRQEQVESGREIEGLCGGLMARAFAGEPFNKDI